MELWGNGNPSGFDPENEGSTPSGSAHFSERGVNMPPFFVEYMTDAQKAEYFSYLEKTKGGETMKCTHPAICDGVCLVCRQKVSNKDDEPQKVETPAEPQETPVKAQETPKKTTRRKKA